MLLPIEPPGPACWQAWTPAQLHAKLRDASGTWYVVGSCALDLWHDAATRDHEDLEFCILRNQFATFRAALRDFDLFAAGDGRVAWLPEDRGPPDDIHQFWGLDRSTGVWRFDMMIEPGTEATWRYKRDPSIRWPRAEVIRVSRAGVPYLHPALVLLFKAKSTRPKDDFDLRNALPRLPLPDRRWLAEQIERLHPGHPWLGLL